MKMPRRALLLAAGLGTRLRPLTLARPKPMMPLWGLPLLERALRLLESWGVEDVAVNTHWRPEVIEAWLAARRGRAVTRVSHEPEILGTGGALKPLRGFLGDAPFWMMNADIAASVDSAPLVAAFEESGFASAWLEPKKGPRTVETDRKGRVTCWHSPMPGVPGTATFCGLQLLSPRIFDFLEEEAFSSVVAAYERAMGEGLFVRGVTVPGSYWDDAGTVEAYLRIHGEVKRLALAGKCGGELYASEHDRSGTAKTFFCVGENARVAEGAAAVNSVVYGDADVLAGSRLSGCVIGGGCVGGVLDGVVCVTPMEETLVRAVEAMGWATTTTAATFLGRRGSDRAFWSVRNGEQCGIVIHYSLTRSENARYAGHARVLAAAGVPVPKVLVDLPEAQCLVLEHCGDDSLQQRMRRKPVESWYRRVIEALARLHRVDGSALALEPAFDGALYAWEHGLFEEHLLKARYGFEGLPAEVAAELRTVASRLMAGRQVLVHRDFQSSNVLFRGEQPVFIDFQGMRLGAGAYDLASLLYDPYVILNETLRSRLAAHYGACFPENAEAVTLLREGAVQRLVQALGAFGRLAGMGHAAFARHIPEALTNLLDVADALELDALGGLTEELIAREKFFRF